MGTDEVSRNHTNSNLLTHSINVYGDFRWYKPESARALFVKGRLLRDSGSAVEGQALLRRAVERRRELVPGDDRPEPNLTEADFDSLIYYYSR